MMDMYFDLIVRWKERMGGGGRKGIRDKVSVLSVKLVVWDSRVEEVRGGEDW